MSLLLTISPEEATGNVALIYQRMQEKVNFIPNVIKLYSASPEFLEKFMSVVGHFIDHPTLDTVLVSYIRLLISNKETKVHIQYFACLLQFLILFFNGLVICVFCSLTLQRLPNNKPIPVSSINGLVFNASPKLTFNYKWQFIH